MVIGLNLGIDHVEKTRKLNNLLFFFGLTGQIVTNTRSRFVLVVWLFLAFVLMQSYTASLSSILMSDQLQPKYFSVNELISKGYYVGYQEGSFTKSMLIEQLKFNESKLKSYANVEEFHKALSKGSQNGGVAAIFDEIPYLKVFLTKYGSDFIMAGPKYRTDGFGFVSVFLKRYS